MSFSFISLFDGCRGADSTEVASYTEEDMQNLTWSEFVETGKGVPEATGKSFLVFIPRRGTHYFQMAMESAGT